MQPPKAEPLQIPSEDDVPLFDPSGLSASLSVDDWHNSFDLSSVAAARLGIGSPPSQQASASLSNSASIANLTRSDSRNNSNSDTGRTSSHPPPPPQHDSDQHADSIDEQYDPRRGRRRRSSAAQSDQHPSSSTAVSSAVLPQKDTSVGSKVRMWWERSEAATPDADANPASTAKQVAGPDSLPPLRTDMRPAESSSAANSTFTSPTVLSPESSSSVVRSPAADFLSAFSSLNSVVQPANSYDARSLSYSPPRAGHRSLGASLMRDDVRNGSAAAPGFASLRGLGSAAAMLYDTQITTAPNPPPRCDDEGARVGPAGRYLLGKTIGFGGFSTVREGWDLDAQGPPDPTAPLIDGQRKGRRVAVKIVYHDSQQGSPAREAGSNKQPHAQSQSHELNIWKSLPVHPHLLPLLHHECLPIDAHHASPTHASGGALAELLIMPYCDQGNLLDFVRSEGAVGTAPYVPNGEQMQAAEDRRSGSGSWIAPGSARSSMQLSRSSSLKASMDDPAWRQSGSRTGSGFMLPRNLGSHALGRVASVSAASQLRTIPAGQEPSSSLASSPVSAAGSASSGSRLIRRTTSRTSRSQGIPLDAARETMRQLASALSALHTKSHVLHGDLKLENVLGQDQSSWKKRQRMSTLQSDGDEARSRQNSAGLADSIDSLAASSVSSRHTFDVTDAVMPCWRLADFGLAQVIDPAHAKSAVPAAPALIRALKEEAKAAHEPKGPRNAQRTGRGGSLAYTAPEYLRAQGRSGSTSPRTPDDLADDDELPTESPFAADMWALGCILYALLSGKLPFSDSFEPRLQMKIAKAQWELPPRLRRRAERLVAASTSTLVSQRSVSNRNSLVDRAGSVEPASVADRFAFSQRRSASGAPHGPSSLGTMDLSASLPSLLPRERQATEPATSALSRRMVAVHSNQVVGSAPGRADHVESFEINSVAKARADVEEDPESDDDSDVDPAWDGLSWDRAAARQVLRGLLEPDPRRRWTIDRLCASAWIRQEGGESGNLAAMAPPASLLNNASAVRNAHSTSLATAAGAADGAASVFAERRAWANSASKSNSSLAETASQSHAAPSFDRANVDEQFQHTERGRRSSSLARTRPEKLATGGSGSASPALTPSISADDGAGAQRRSRSTSRISVVHRDSSRTRSTDVSGSSTPNRERDPAWMAHHLGSSLNSISHAWVHSASKERCDSPAESERRGRLPRSRMADLDENTTWNGEDDTSSDSRAGSHVAGSLHRTGPIAIRGRSGSRSRSRHSGESGSPERFAHHRSISRSRSNYSLSHEAGAPGSLLYGRSVEPQPTVAPIMADHTQAQRSSTARSRSRAPDALAQILGRQRSRSRSRMRDSSANPAPGVPPAGAAGVAAIKSAPTPSDSEHEQEARGRARDRR